MEQPIRVLFLFTIILFVLILLKLIAFLVIHFFHSTPSETKGKRENPITKVDVVISAFDEEKVIVETIQKILNNNFTFLTIIVVDDGSTDGTLEVLKNNFNNNSKVKIVGKRNTGKASSLNYALSFVSSEIVIFIDADTHVKNNFITDIVSQFTHNSITALAGYLEVRNKVNMLTIMQNIEYKTTQNLEREYLNLVGIFTTIPGAACAFRYKDLVELGCFRNSMVTEDCDITYRIIRKGLRIKNTKSAVGYTEAPQSIKMFMRQRVRWNYGLLQNLVNNSKIPTKKPKQGDIKVLLMLLYSWLYKFFYKALYPLADYTFVITLVYVFHNYHIGYLLFIFFENLIFSIAILREIKTIRSNLILIYFYRIFYRHLMFFSIVIAFNKFLFGNNNVWSKIQRYTEQKC